ncbi:homoserine O-succinyltransferase [Christensenellaceae bacterium OttesenSCG-928-M15]|nr:homoserine O-succinyltransferase [Christensenellaceae bacterium OttesenSCG-928-M15]
MPVTIPNGLPAFDILAKENIFVMPQERATMQDIRPLRIAVLNLMPTKVVTETQLMRVLGNTALQIEVTLLCTGSYQPRHTDIRHLDAFYRTFEDVKDELFDGLIITGAPIEQMPFEDVAYWEELVEIMDWASENVYSTIFICWAAQAALYHYYGIRKYPLPQKLFGVYSHHVLNPTHRLLRGFDDVFFAPHSRHTAINVNDIIAHPALEALAVSEQAGLYLAASRDGRRVFVTGHGEYDPETLELEYKRDLKAGLSIEPPANYYPDNDCTQPPRVTWRAHGNMLYSNWLNYFVYQETPYVVEQIKDYGHQLS